MVPLRGVRVAVMLQRFVESAGRLGYNPVEAIGWRVKAAQIVRLGAAEEIPEGYGDLMAVDLAPDLCILVAPDLQAQTLGA